MPRFAANLSMLFTEVPLLDRFEQAARAGFKAVEMQFPYEAPAAALRDWRACPRWLAMAPPPRLWRRRCPVSFSWSP